MYGRRHTLAGRAGRLMLILAFCAGWTASGEAAPVTFTFTGAVTGISTSPGDPHPPGIPVGSAIDGQFTFESTAPDLIQNVAEGLFTSLGAPYGLTVTIGASTFSTSGYLGIHVYNDTDGEDLFVLQACPENPCHTMTTGLFLRDFGGTVFGGDALPATAPPLGAFESTQFWLYGPIGPGGGFVEIAGSLNSLACSGPGCEPASTPVPEPGTLGMVGLAVSALIGRGARFRRRNQA